MTSIKTTTDLNGTSHAPAPAPTTQDSPSIYTTVQNGYSRIASQPHSTAYSTTIASAFGYSEAELTDVPAESNLGLSCGNPLALASIRVGETVVDLGSGAGFDVFQAAKMVGPERKGGGRGGFIKEKIGAKNTEFVESPITKIDLPGGMADCVISNCVINLVPTGEKQLVFDEMYRLLRSKGRVAISDILLRKNLPEELRGSMALYVGCIAGASKVEEYQRYLSQAGFRDVLIVPDQSDLNVYKTASKDDPGASKETGCCGSGCGGNVSLSGDEKSVVEDAKWADVDFNEWAGSYKVYAVKP
ncbi:uncharacterized protein KY384_007926 [Bacidia gigantensis]|uniref:uncharacterized protein n=1 Tax=Bacidia gigantensis TaxID=2732470 RepID=UPI001D037818|nr:uncharacterized protein KY384_007926 [Bacidia gigantensis]KAG8527772.1 hypothetical protein KY384_007926 [Bacidia gigantensis]